MISFSRNRLEAWADFIPPGAGGKALDLDYVKRILQGLKIVTGIREEVILQALEQCKQGGKAVRNVLIARGIPPVNEIEEHYALNPALAEIKAPLSKKGRIDHRSRSTFIVVEKGEILARFNARSPGSEGTDLHGKAVPYKTVGPHDLRGGRNTRTENGCITAQTAGLLEQAGRVLNVRDSLEIRGPVGYATGNIVFPGDVVLDGPVADGFTVYSGGSIRTRETFDISDVITRKDLIVEGGIKGRGRGLVKVGGELKARFIENCRIACRKRVAVESGILNSRVFSMDRIDLGSWGRLIGGEYSAIHGIRAGSIGSRSGAGTRIRCGIDEAALQEKARLEHRMRIIKDRLGKLKILIPEAEAGKRPPMIKLWIRLHNEGKKTTARIAELSSRIYADTDACIEVNGAIGEGVHLEICQASLYTEEPLRRVRIRLDKTCSRLIADPLR
ncbi:MAG: FapA family protein [Treponema sp.]|nr:FapA family protein [Treponema sp.]